jgi:membrane-associated PAP2 superfamily phosphatase
MKKKINGYLFIILHILCPVIILLTIIIGLELFNIDVILSSFFYDFESNEWPLKNDWLTKTVFHDWGQKLSIFMGVIIFILLLFSFFFKKLKQYSKPLLFLFISSISGPILIAILKNSTHIYCPWNLEMFGGNKPYIKLLDAVDSSLSIGHCFPGGHSGGGFAFISLYYYLMLVNPKYRFYGLGAGIFIGSIFGLTQEVRGAHFLSHDVSSFFICWVLTSTLFIMFFYKQLFIEKKECLVVLIE